MILIQESLAEYVDTVMQGTFYRGLFGMNGALDFQCPSSNCTWPDCTTLALCSTCQDVTASTQIQEQDCDGPDIISLTAPEMATDENFLDCTKYIFTTPGGGTLIGFVALENFTGFGNGTRMGIISTVMVANYFGGLGFMTTGNDYTLLTTVNVAKFKWSNT